jgi:Flp pilus assembly protein TadB
MTLMLIWGFLIVLLVAVAFLFWFQFKTSTVQSQDIYVAQLEEKVVHLELHLKRVWKLCRISLRKCMYNKKF